MTTIVYDTDQYETRFWEPIGKFVIQFGYLEKTIDWSISCLLGLHERQGEAIASQTLNLRSRIRLIEKLCYLVTADSTHREAITEIIEEIVDLNTYRNGLLHGQWGNYHFPSGGAEPYWAKLDVNPQNFKYREFQVRYSELVSKLDEIWRLNSRLGNRVQLVMNEHNRRLAEKPQNEAS